jgi:hypothetical protein
MELTAQHIEGITRENFWISRAEFVAVWAAAERALDELKGQGDGDLCLVRVVRTCRWIATAIAPSIVGRPERSSASISHRQRRLMRD